MKQSKKTLLCQTTKSVIVLNMLLMSSVKIPELLLGYVTGMLAMAMAKWDSYSMENTFDETNENFRKVESETPDS